MAIFVPPLEAAFPAITAPIIPNGAAPVPFVGGPDCVYCFSLSPIETARVFTGGDCSDCELAVE